MDAWVEVEREVGSLDQYEEALGKSLEQKKASRPPPGEHQQVRDEGGN